MINVERWEAKTNSNIVCRAKLQSEALSYEGKSMVNET